MCSDDSGSARRISYAAHWDLPSGLSALPIPIPGTTPKPHLIKGRTVKETGRFSLSGEILLLEPSTTELYEVQNGSAPPLVS